MARTSSLLRAAVGAGAAALLAGCTYAIPVQSTVPYAPSDGFRVEIATGVLAENIMVLAAEEGGEGQVFGSLVNNTESEVTMTLSIDDGGINAAVPANSTVLLGVDEPVIIPSVSVAPGALLEGSLQASGYGSMSIAVPVLDGTLPEYTEYVPTGTP